MKTGKKIALAVGAAALLGVAGWIGYRQMNKGVITVQTATVGRRTLASVVTSSGEIKPLTYTNVMAEGFGKIIGVTVKEGDLVNKGDILLRLEDIQPAADVAAQSAGLDSAQAAVRSASRQRHLGRSRRGAAQGRARTGPPRMGARAGALQGPAHFQAGLRWTPRRV